MPMKYLLASILIGIALSLSPMNSVDANISTRTWNTNMQEEWLPASPIDTIKEVVALEQIEYIRSGDNAISLLGRLGFSYEDSTAIVSASQDIHSLRKIRSGRSLVKKSLNDSVDLYYNIDREYVLHLYKNETWQAAKELRAVSSRQVLVQGSIRNSLFMDAAVAGLDEASTMKLINDVFAWDIDFSRDIKKGDSFRVLLDERFDQHGEVLGSEILMAEFTNKGKVFHAVRSQDEHGAWEYYSPTGKKLRSGYLKSPVKFSRISSRFNLHRKHPVLGYTRAHRGVDYAAKTGTAIRAIGDGVITYLGRRGGYGRYIQIRHNNKAHTTAYAHMRRYASSLKKGSHVKQGQIIGYVGQSGTATGPHLHFEFRINNRAVNPLTVKAMAHVEHNKHSATYLAEVRQLMKSRLAVMNQMEPQLFAWN
ncbi:MAG: peptidoglycan DD-metalloendopeptidase family protein [Mariprofundaceae bacterium]|nr:peptidoglycan DD-metalloendopeptidase family protein [Mariprofundaceae bacterium]